MIISHGHGISDDVAIGRLYFYTPDAHVIKKESVQGADTEIQRFDEARTEAVRRLDALYESSLDKVGKAGAMIFKIHQMMIDDIDYIKLVERTIREQHTTAEFAVSTASDSFSRMLAETNDDYMRARAADVRDASEHILKILLGEHTLGIQSDEPVIIAAEDLAPSQTIQFDKSKILGFITFKGSVNSHTAILARTMDLPAVVATGEIDSSCNGAIAIINGSNGTVIINPDVPTLEYMRRLKHEKDEKHGRETKDNSVNSNTNLADTDYTDIFRRGLLLLGQGSQNAEN